MGPASHVLKHGTHSTATAPVGSARVGRHICQSVASGVCFQTQSRLRAFVFNFIYFSFLESHAWQPQRANCKADERQQQSERGWRMSGFVCRRDFSYQSDVGTDNCVFVRFRCTAARAHFLTCKSSLMTEEKTFCFLQIILKQLTTFGSLQKKLFSDFTP